MKTHSELTTDDFTVKGLDEMTRLRLEELCRILGFDWAGHDVSLFNVFSQMRRKIEALQREAAK